MIIIFLVVLLLFGAKRIPEIAQGLGKGIREFKDATGDIKREMTATPPAAPHQIPQTPAAPVTAVHSEPAAPAYAPPTVHVQPTSAQMDAALAEPPPAGPTAEPRA